MTETEIQELRAKFRGQLITPADAAYDAARKVYEDDEMWTKGW